MMTIEGKLQLELAEAEHKALDYLGRYQFTMFGYWAGIWAHLNRMLPRVERRANPFTRLVLEARKLAKSTAD